MNHTWNSVPTNRRPGPGVPQEKAICSSCKCERYIYSFRIGDEVKKNYQYWKDGNLTSVAPECTTPELKILEPAIAQH